MMENTLVERILQNSELNYLSPFQKTLASLYESNGTSDIENYAALMRDVITRVEITSTIPFVASVVPLTTPEGKLPVFSLEYDKSATSTASNIKVFLLGSIGAFSVGDTVTGDVSAAEGNILYIEGDKVLVEVTSGTFQEEAINTATTTITSIWSNKVGVGQLFENYSGPYTTPTSEGMTVTQKNSFALKVGNIQASSKSRDIATNLTVEYIQDLIAQYGVEAKEKVISAVSDAIKQEIEKEVFTYIRSIATQLPDMVMTDSYGTNSGLNNILHDLIIRANKSKGRIGTDTNIAGQYFVIGSSRVIGAINSVGKVVPFPEYSAKNTKLHGTLTNGNMTLIEDPFSLDDYMVVGNVGFSGFDNGGVVYSPYGIIIKEVTDSENFQEVLGITTRYDINRSPLDTKTVGSDFFELTAVDFTNLANW